MTSRKERKMPDWYFSVVGPSYCRATYFDAPGSIYIVRDKLSDDTAVMYCGAHDSDNCAGAAPIDDSSIGQDLRLFIQALANDYVPPRQAVERQFEWADLVKRYEVPSVKEEVEKLTAGNLEYPSV